MPSYNARLYNDMGHLMISTNGPALPEHVRRFVYAKAQLYLNFATDTKGLGARYFILKHGLVKEWTYTLGSDTVTITFDVNKFDSHLMRYV